MGRTFIGEHLSDLTNDLQKSLGFASHLSLPTDLSLVFEKLDFISSEKISLKNRGDGIKARHIPHILYFMAQSKKKLSKRGGPRHTIIWGYEEPENNLEMSSCSLLAEEILFYNFNGIAQTFLTTHSPIFYNVAKEHIKTSSIHYIYKDIEENTTLATSDIPLNSLDSRMGVTQIYAERIKTVQNEIEKLKKEAKENEKAFDELKSKNSKARIFVEGFSDKIIFDRCIKAFYPELAGKVDVETKADGAGHTYVIDMLEHWRARHKHHPNEPKAVGVVDDDATSEKKTWNKNSKNVLSAKCFLLPKSQTYIEVDRTTYKVLYSLETMYPSEVWQYAFEKGWLNEKARNEILTEAIITKILEEEKKPSDYIKKDTPLFITHSVNYDKKISIAKHLASKSDEYFETNIPVLKQLLEEIKEYLNL